MCVMRKALCVSRAALGFALIAAIVVLLGACSFLPLDGVADGDDTENGADGENGDDTSLTADSYEDNDDFQSAAGIGMDTSTSASIHDNEDADFFSFTTGYSSATFDKFEVQLEPASQDLHARLEVFNASGARIQAIRADTPGQSITYTLTCPGGDYAVRVSGWDTVMGWDHGSHGAYSLRVSHVHANDAYAPNHSLDTAAAVELDTALEGEIVSSSEEDDYFVFTNPNPAYWQRFQLTFGGVSPEYQVHTKVYDANRSEISDGEVRADNAGAGLSLDFATKSSEFLVQVYGYDYWGNTKGSYTLTATVLEGNDDNEPDDSLDTAREITGFPAEVSLSGTIVADAGSGAPEGDFECFVVTLRAGKQVTIEADPAASDTELHFRVYDSSQTERDSADGDNGETIGYMPYNDGSSDVEIYVELGGYLESSKNGDYTISFTEADYQP